MKQVRETVTDTVSSPSKQTWLEARLVTIVCKREGKKATYIYNTELEGKIKICQLGKDGSVINCSIHPIFERKEGIRTKKTALKNLEQMFGIRKLQVKD